MTYIIGTNIIYAHMLQSLQDEKNKTNVMYFLSLIPIASNYNNDGFYTNNHLPLSFFLELHGPRNDIALLITLEQGQLLRKLCPHLPVFRLYEYRLNTNPIHGYKVRARDLMHIPIKNIQMNDFYQIVPIGTNMLIKNKMGGDEFVFDWTFPHATQKLYMILSRKAYTNGDREWKNIHSEHWLLLDPKQYSLLSDNIRSYIVYENPIDNSVTPDKTCVLM